MVTFIFFSNDSFIFFAHEGNHVKHNLSFHGPYSSLVSLRITGQGT